MSLLKCLVNSLHKHSVSKSSSSTTHKILFGRNGPPINSMVDFETLYAALNAYKSIHASVALVPVTYEILDQDHCYPAAVWGLKLGQQLEQRQLNEMDISREEKERLQGLGVLFGLQDKYVI